MIIPYTDIFQPPDSIGSAVSRRIGQRQKDQLKVHFLKRLSLTPLFDQIVLRSGSALHGVYLHERYTEDLDFFALPALAHNAQAAFAEVEMVLEHRADGIAPIYAAPGLAQARVEIGVDVLAASYPEESFLVPEPHTFRSVSGETAPVRTYPLPALLARKLRYVMWRRFAVDFYDLWIGLEKHPEAAPDIREIVRRREVGVADKDRYRAEVAQAGLDALKASWHEELAALMPRVPEFQQVRQGLAHWLPLFENKER